LSSGSDSFSFQFSRYSTPKNYAKRDNLSTIPEQVRPARDGDMPGIEPSSFSERGASVQARLSAGAADQSHE
jgi:hypothetical protein